MPSPITIQDVNAVTTPSPISGPLSPLDFDRNAVKILQYPSDLATNPARAHYVMITAKEVVPVELSEQDGKQIIDNAIKSDITQTLKPTAKNISSMISLYMPDTLNMQYAASYESFSLTDALGTVGRIAQTALDAAEGQKNGQSSLKNLVSGPAALELAGNAADATVGTRGGADVLLRAGGYAINPQLQLLYKGIDLRSFQLDFVFTPKSKAEADTIKAIINQFTYHFLPDIRGATGGEQGQYFVMPSIFNLSFRFAGDVGVGASNSLPAGSATDNPNLYKVGDCVLENMNVDYAPNGWASYTDGAPIQTKLTLQFKETDIMHRKRFLNGEVR
jgi:hypothetical protein